MFADEEELQNFISANAHAESRSCEFKSGVRWEGDFRYKIVKGILALSNLAGGGYIIVGVVWNDATNTFDSIGMDKETVDTYDHDAVLEFANIRADPFVRTDLKHFKISGKWFVAIQVSEFLEIPVVCKKTCADNTGKIIIEEGRIYYRTRKKPESSPNLTYVEMREILDYATTKSLGILLRRLESAGLPIGTITQEPSDEEQFEGERESFG